MEDFHLLWYNLICAVVGPSASHNNASIHTELPQPQLLCISLITLLMLFMAPEYLRLPAQPLFVKLLWRPHPTFSSPKLRFPCKFCWCPASRNQSPHDLPASCCCLLCPASFPAGTCSLLQRVCRPTLTTCDIVRKHTRTLQNSNDDSSDFSQISSKWRRCLSNSEH